MTKYIALAFASFLMMQTAALADEVKSSTTEINDGQTSSSTSATSENGAGGSSTYVKKTVKPIAPSRYTTKRSDSYSNDGAVEQKETQTETKVNP
jgi:hypothetical protein